MCPGGKWGGPGLLISPSCWCHPSFSQRKSLVMVKKRTENITNWTKCYETTQRFSLRPFNQKNWSTIREGNTFWRQRIDKQRKTSPRKGVVPVTKRRRENWNKSKSEAGWSQGDGRGLIKHSLKTSESHFRLHPATIRNHYMTFSRTQHKKVWVWKDWFLLLFFGSF